MIDEALSFIDPSDRVCKGCAETKPLSEFYAYIVDGKQYWRWHCRPCLAQRNREWGDANRERRSAQAAERYRADPKRWAEASRRYRERNRETIAARERERRSADPAKAREIARKSYWNDPSKARA